MRTAARPAGTWTCPSARPMHRSRVTIVDQSRVPAGDPWVRVGNAPFRFESANPDHFVRLVARPGNHVTAFDAVKLVRSGTGGSVSRIRGPGQP